MFNVFRPENRVWLALALTLVACAWVTLNDDAENIAPVVPVTRLATPTKNSRMSLDISSPIQTPYRRTPITRSPQPLFTADTHSTSSDVQATTTPLENAPPLPFVHAGKLIEDGKFVVFLLEGDRNIVAHKGDVLDKRWLVSAITPPKMTFIYLPLKTKHMLDIGEVN
ncbi:MAG TPA: hypothetical protein VGJ90_09510 [Methylophilaceae bacterium]